MAGPAGVGDPHLEQAMLAQLPPVSYLSRWQRGNSTPPPSPAPAGTAAAAPPAAQGQASAASPGGGLAQAGASGAAAADGPVQTAEAKQAARSKPVPPPRSGEQRQAARLEALRMTAQRKGLRARLQAGELTLEQALAEDEEAARGMRVVTVVRALPGIGAATAARLMREAGIDAARRVGALTMGQAARLLAAIAAVEAELAAPLGRRTEHVSPVLRSRAPGKLRPVISSRPSSSRRNCAAISSSCWRRRVSSAS
jgi:S13-like protein